MAIEIGGVSCTLIMVRLSDLTQRVTSWQVPGLTGYGAQTLGMGDSGSLIRLIKYGNTAEVEAWIVAVQLLKGTIVAVTEQRADSEVTYTSLLVQGVSQPAVRAAYVPGGTIRERGEIVVRGVVMVPIA